MVLSNPDKIAKTKTWNFDIFETPLLSYDTGRRRNPGSCQMIDFKPKLDGYLLALRTDRKSCR